MSEHRKRVYEYLVLYHPKPERKGDPVASEIIVPRDSLLSHDEAVAAMMVARLIPEGYVDKLDRCEICLRPF